MNRRISFGVLLLLFLLLNYSSASAQQRLKFSVLEFGQDAFDLSAQSEETKKIDGSGSLYAIIKVTSDNPDDDLRAYQFNFGNMNHLVEDHDDQLWLYVQKNAKHVTITRQGYTPVRNYDLRTTIEAGRNYVMRLSAQGPVIYTQMVMFTIKPAEADPVVTIKGIEEGAVEQSLKRVDVSGQTAKNLPYGTYSYRVLSENYFPSEGRITLNDKTKTHHEDVVLRPRFSSVTLQVDANADIYVNGEKKGLRTWSGMLNAGIYSVECRQPNHKTTTQSITVKENTPFTFDLVPPTPITGTLSVLSDPLGANIVIDGKEYGQTPCNLDLLIGEHTVTISHDNYVQEKAVVEVKENEIAELNLKLTDVPVTPKEKTFTVNGVSFVMKFVEGGTFMMGATAEQGDDASENEKPAHQVTLDSYYIGETEVTQELWQAVMGKKNNLSHNKGEKLPVENVSWNDCQKFINKLNTLTGQRFRLPTEAEWEYAARGGTISQGYKFSGSNNCNEVAWYEANSGNKTHDVKMKSPNELGLYDMSGNVAEWCQDWYDKYMAFRQTNPLGASFGSTHVVRGGNWRTLNRTSRVSARMSWGEDVYYPFLGLRLVLETEKTNNKLSQEQTSLDLHSLSQPSDFRNSGDRTFTVNGVSFTMKAVKEGKFTMGGTSEQGSDVSDNEIPAHKVTLNNYFIGETEVTQELWQAVMGSNPSIFIGDHLPVENVSWNDCQEFLIKLNEITGQHFRLPTEAEWEYAARGGAKKSGFKYSGNNNPDNVAWHKTNSEESTHNVKTKDPNKLGVYDMSGNVDEWCYDWYENYMSFPQENPTGSERGKNRVVRGGNWRQDNYFCRVSSRYCYKPDFKDNNLGLRLAL